MGTILWIIPTRKKEVMDEKISKEEDYGN